MSADNYSVAELRHDDEVEARDRAEGDDQQRRLREYLERQENAAYDRKDWDLGGWYEGGRLLTLSAQGFRTIPREKILEPFLLWEAEWEAGQKGAAS